MYLLARLFTTPIVRERIAHKWALMGEDGDFKSALQLFGELTVCSAMKRVMGLPYAVPNEVLLDMGNYGLPPQPISLQLIMKTWGGLEARASPVYLEFLAATNIDRLDPVEMQAVIEGNFRYSDVECKAATLADPFDTIDAEDDIMAERLWFLLKVYEELREMTLHADYQYSNDTRTRLAQTMRALFPPDLLQQLFPAELTQEIREQGCLLHSQRFVELGSYFPEYIRGPAQELCSCLNCMRHRSTL